MHCLITRVIRILSGIIRDVVKLCVGMLKIIIIPMKNMWWFKAGFLLSSLIKLYKLKQGALANLKINCYFHR